MQDPAKRPDDHGPRSRSELFIRKRRLDKHVDRDVASISERAQGGS
jgi:hypothetical protein